MITKIVLATPHRRYDNLEESLRNIDSLTVARLREKDHLNLIYLKELCPDFIFFPHWSWIIPAEIYENFQCIIFHMTDLPFGRGGSPLQNLVVRKIYETKLTALKCVREVDAGPVYLKRDLSLHGSAEEIFCRAAVLMEEMICQIIQNPLPPVEQTGVPVVFKRRTPNEGNVSQVTDLQALHDMIRMLDAEGYPPAFITIGSMRLEFSRSRLSYNNVTADVRITFKN